MDPSRPPRLFASGYKTVQNEASHMTSGLLPGAFVTSQPLTRIANTATFRCMGPHCKDCIRDVCIVPRRDGSASCDYDLPYSNISFSAMLTGSWMIQVHRIVVLILHM